MGRGSCEMLLTVEQVGAGSPSPGGKKHQIKQRGSFRGCKVPQEA